MDLNEYRAKKQGKTTVKECLKDVIDQQDDLESVIFVAKRKDGRILTGWSDISHTEAIGMLHIGQNEIERDTFE